MDSQLARIYELKTQLLQLGYHGVQVDAMLREIVGAAIPEEVGPEKRQQIIEALEKYARFAIKARRGGRDLRRHPGNNCSP
jgi:hypothetical protein